MIDENRLSTQSRDVSRYGALPDQVAAILSVTHELISLRHRVFREYVKIAVGSDLVHTIPSFVVLVATCLILWKKPPSFKCCLTVLTEKLTAHKIIQVAASWVIVNAVLWYWLIFQRLVYSYIWSNWGYATNIRESKYRETSLPWWQTFWTTVEPPPLETPVLSAGFISWTISMVLAVGTLYCALTIDRVGKIVDDGAQYVQEVFESWSGRFDSISKKLLENILTTKQVTELEENSEISSVCDDRRSEISFEAAENQETTQKPEIHPISYGTNWTPRPNFPSNGGNRKLLRRKGSLQSLRTVAGGDESNHPEVIKFSPRQLRSRRGCHSVINNYSSDNLS